MGWFLYPARRLTCLPRDWGWQCPLPSSDYNSAVKATVVFGTCWSLICSTVLYTEMKNIWSAHMLCLDWWHKCMRLCNPDMWFPFSLSWSISYFVFSCIRQPAGQLPGAVAQTVSYKAWPISTGQSVTTTLVFKNTLYLFCLPTHEAKQS